MKYEELIKLSNDERSEIDIPYEVERATMEAELEVIKLRKEIAEQKQKLNKAKTSVPISFPSVRDCMNAQQLSERKLEQTIELQKELF